VIHVRQPLRVINLLDEFLAKKVKDNTKLRPVGRLGKTVSAVDTGRSNPR
jgi:hypothetical protein